MQNINFVIVLTYCTINIINGGVSRSRTIAAAGRPDEGDRWQEIRGEIHEPYEGSGRPWLFALVWLMYFGSLGVLPLGVAVATAVCRPKRSVNTRQGLMPA